MADKTKEAWEFLYLGCNLDAMKDGAEIGILAGQTLSFAGPGMVSSYRDAARATRVYASSRAANPSERFLFSPKN